MTTAELQKHIADALPVEQWGELIEALQDQYEDFLEVNDPVKQREVDLSMEDYKAGRFGPADELLVELRKIHQEAHGA